VIELPVAAFQNVKPFEELVLFTLGEHGEFESVSNWPRRSPPTSTSSTPTRSARR